jgi:hypothetical protein
MTESDPREKATHQAGNWQMRFGLGSLMLAMSVACVMAAAASYSFQAIRGHRSMRFVLVLFTVAGPVLLLLIVSFTVALLSWLRRSTDRSYRDADD